MQSSTLRSGERRAPAQAQLFDLDGLRGYLQRLHDRRCPKGRRYGLSEVLLLIILAKLAGQDRPCAIADWIRCRGGILNRALGLGWKRMPHHNTYRRILAGAVTPEELERTLGAYLASRPGGAQSVLIAIDGKTVRGTLDGAHPRGEHLLAAYLPAQGIVLMQVQAGPQENEVLVAPRLLACLDLRGKVVTADALHTQRALSVQILQAGGDYLWLAKGNQPTLRREIALVFASSARAGRGGEALGESRAHSIDKGHGRLEIRRIRVSSALKGYSDWPGLEQVFLLERNRITLKGGKRIQEQVYGLTSLSPAQASPAHLLSLVRGYWGIENGLHHCRDVTFGEDGTRLTQGWAGWTMAALNNLVISLLRLCGTSNLAAARREADAYLTLSLPQLAARSLT